MRLGAGTVVDEEGLGAAGTSSLRRACRGEAEDAVERLQLVVWRRGTGRGRRGRGAWGVQRRPREAPIQSTQRVTGRCAPAGAKRWSRARVERLGVTRGVALLVVSDIGGWRRGSGLEEVAGDAAGHLDDGDEEAAGGVGWSRGGRGGA